MLDSGAQKVLEQMGLVFVTVFKRGGVPAAFRVCQTLWCQAASFQAASFQAAKLRTIKSKADWLPWARAMSIPL